VNSYVGIASRRSGSAEITLCWDDAEFGLIVLAHDELTGKGVEIPVDRHNAADVYRDPFAYVSRKSRAGTPPPS